MRIRTSLGFASPSPFRSSSFPLALLLFLSWACAPSEPPAPHSPSPEKPWKVLVVEKATGRPVPGAQVLLLDPALSKDPAGMIRKMRPSAAFPLERLLLEEGMSYPTDRKGIASIPAPSCFFSKDSLAARKGRLWGWVKDPSPPVRIELSPLKEVRVQVRDSSGRPVAGVPVGFGLQTDPGLFFYFEKIRTRGPRGIARCLFTHPAFRNPKKRHKGRAALLVPAERIQEKSFDLRNPPKDPLVFTLPPTGKVILEVRGSKGLLPDGWCLAALRPKRGRRERRGPIEFGAFPLSSVEGGKAVFPFVGLGLDLQALVAAGRANFPFFHSKEKNGLWAEIECKGPAAPGETRVVKATLRSPARISGRLFLPGGKPAGERNFFWKWVPKKNDNFFTLEIGYGFSRTGEEGDFHLFLPGGKPGTPPGSLLIFPFASTRWAPFSARIHPAVPFPEGGEVSLGEIRLRPRRFLASGRVVDPGGNPVPRAVVEIGRGKERCFFFMPASLRHLSGGRCGEDGRFCLFGTPSSKEDLFLRASKKGWFPKNEVSFSPGAKGLKLVLEKAGALQASFLADPDVSMEDFQADLHYSTPKKWIFRGEILGNRALWNSLPPGRAVLEISLPGPDIPLPWRIRDRFPKAPPLVEIKNIHVESGKTLRDPRLNGIDLRGKIRSVEIDLRDPKGNLLKKGILLWGEGFKFRLDFYCRWTFYLPGSAPAEAWVGAPGFRPKKIILKNRPMKVTLERGIPVKLLYTGKAPLPARPLRLGVTLEPGNGEGRTGEKRKDPAPFFLPLEPVPFGKDGALRIDLPAPGSYRVRWRLWDEEEDPEDYESPSPRSKQPQTLQVRESRTLQTFRLSLPGKALEKALRRFRK